MMPSLGQAYVSIVAKNYVLIYLVTEKCDFSAILPSFPTLFHNFEIWTDDHQHQLTLEMILVAVSNLHHGSLWIINFK